MKISSQHAIPGARDNVWRELNDVDVLKRCIPGCETVERVSPTEYRAVVALKIGPVKARFKGNVILQELEPLALYSIKGRGQGGIAGFGSGEAIVRLSEVDANETLLDYEVEMQIGGKIAQIGSRLVQGIVATLADQFFSAFTTHLAEDRRAAG